MSTGISDAYPSSSMPFTPDTEFALEPFIPDIPMPSMNMEQGHMRSQSFDIPMSGLMQWDQNPQEMLMPYQVTTTNSMATPYQQLPMSPPNMQPMPVRPRPSSTMNSGSCNCFQICLQSLQALHNVSAHSPPPFDLVLSVNSKAISGCAAMLYQGWYLNEPTSC